MYLCYLDESGDTGPRGSRHFILGAVALFEGQWGRVQDGIRNLIARFFPPPLTLPKELHFADVRCGKRDFAKISAGDRTAMIDDACALVTNLLETEVRLFSVAIDKNWWFIRNPGKRSDDLYLYAFENLVSRFDLFMRRRHAFGASTRGIVIADPHTPSMSRSLKLELGRYQSLGTRWRDLHNVVETVLFLDSHESPGLQLADLCSYSLWRLAEHSDDRIAANLAPAFDREPLNSTQNPGRWHGVKYFGDDRSIQQMINRVWQ
ncbi:MAG: DUF3800 domain-containing protein [Candidatus Methylomirabilis sp.]|nr:DUF3800 domain-containing protein [Deltaproteobacteria bacterium]